MARKNRRQPVTAPLNLQDLGSEATLNPCCRCCVAAAERGKLDHQVGNHCPYPRCGIHQP